MTTLAPDPATRWNTAGELVEALETVTVAAGITIEDSDVAAWVTTEFGEPTRRKIPARTADIEDDVELDVEQAFARVRTRSKPIA